MKANSSDVISGNNKQITFILGENTSRIISD